MYENAVAAARVDRRDPVKLEPPRRRLRLGRINLEVRQHLSFWQQALFLGGSILLGLAVSGITLVVAGVDASDLINEFIVDTLFDKESLRAVLFQAAPLNFVGLGASVAFRVRFWNLGIEGQMIWGGIGATFVTFFHVGPEATRIPVMMLFAVAAGMAWVLVPALLRMKLRVNEIISTLLLNYVAFNFLLHLLYGAWQDPKDGFPHSPAFQPFERLPDIAGVSSALLLALLFMLVTAWLAHMSRIGFYMRFVDANDRMALAVGVPIGAVTLGSVLYSGALSALGGFVIAASQEGRLTQSFFEGYGFSGVLIAFLARNNPVAATLVALLVAVLFVAGKSLQVFYQIPFAMVQLIQAIMVICVAASEFLIRHRVHWVR